MNTCLEPNESQRASPSPGSTKVVVCQLQQGCAQELRTIIFGAPHNLQLSASTESPMLQPSMHYENHQE